MIKKAYKAFVILAAAITVIGMIVVLLLWGISSLITSFQSTDYATFYEDVDKETICSSHNSYSALSKSIISKGEKSYNDSNYDFELMSNVDISIKRLNGLMIVNQSKTINSMIRFKISTSLEEGKMRIFVIKNNSEILQEVEVGEDVVLEYYSDGETTYTIKVLALDAKIRMNIERTIES